MSKNKSGWASMAKTQSKFAKERANENFSGDDGAKGMFKRAKTIFKADEEVQSLKLSEGPNVINIIPFSAGSNNPLPNVSEGSPQEFLLVRVHRYVGEASLTFLCPKTYDLPCPICKDRQEKWTELERKGYDKKAIGEELQYCKSSIRTFCNVIVLNTPEDILKGIQVLEVAKMYLYDPIEILVKDVIKGGYRCYGDLGPEGKSVKFHYTASKQVGNRPTLPKWLSHDFVDRDVPFMDDKRFSLIGIEDVYQLDQVVDLKSYAEIEEAYRSTSALKEENSYTVGSTSTPEDSPPLQEEIPDNQSITKQQVQDDIPDFDAPPPVAQESVQEELPFDGDPPPSTDSPRQRRKRKTLIT